MGFHLRSTASTRQKAELMETDHEVLSTPKLRNLEQRCWTSYKFNHWGVPSDYVVTSAVMQLRSRRITRPNMLQVKTLRHGEDIGNTGG